eukprot:TRINITY_DN472_c0_g1_i1.p1 TRINITY_DN472_c0_g1~~TRINITY_DN472_c0_g1_i1.p1  ORF type:complete len:201 (-),score=21.63 TRINITY_DN472_c0_g1_i1:144-746(-)
MSSISMSRISVRAAQEHDFPSITDIYAWHVRESTATFEEVPPSVNEMRSRWYAIMNDAHPYLVAVQNDHLLGYAYATTYRPRSAYRYSVEASVYLSNDCIGKGVGSLLLASLLDELRARGKARQVLLRLLFGTGSCLIVVPQQVVAGLGTDNVQSSGLFKKFGFKDVGVLKSIGFKHGKWLDRAFMQLDMDEWPLTLSKL